MASSVDEETLKQKSLPQILFRWCPTISCQAKEIHLHLNSLFGPDIPLEWKCQCGWYESALVSLPLGLHTGYILVREKVDASIFLADCQSLPASIKEQNYKIDPFFVTPHEFGVELFVQTDSTEVLSVIDELGERRPLSSRLCTFREPFSDKLSTKRKCVSCESFTSFIGNRSNKNSNFFPSILPDSLKCDSRYTSSGLGLCDETAVTTPPYRDRLRKSYSLDENSNSLLLKYTPDSLYCSKSRSFNFDNSPPPLTRSTLEISKKSRSYEDCKDSLYQKCSANSKSYLPPSLKTTLALDVNKLLEEVSARTQSIEELIRESDEEIEEKEKGVDELSVHSYKKQFYFKEVDPPKNENFGCLITFESRSTSMNDVGSPTALEDVIVSLASTEDSNSIVQVSSLVKNDHNLNNGAYKHNISSVSEDKKLNISWNSSLEKHPSLSKSSTQGSSQKSVDIYEDENFQFDSLKTDERKFSLDIKGVLSSEDSCDINGDHFESSQNLPNVKSLRAVDHSSQLDENHYLSRFPSSQKYRISVSPRNSDLSADVSGSSFFVNPGSLPSDNGTSGTIVGSFESSFGCIDEKTYELSPIGGSKTVNDVCHSTHKPKTNDFSASVYSYSSENRNNENVLTDNRTLTKEKKIEKTNKMSSIGTQTLRHESETKGHHSLGSSFSSSEKENSHFSPLPDKIKFPWQPSYTRDKNKIPEYPYSPNTKLKYLQKYLYNIAKADQILKDIHPFDYRPTILHNRSPCENTFNRPLKSNKKAHFSLLRKNIMNSTPVSSSYKSYSHYIQSRSEERRTYADSEDRFLSSRKLKKVVNPLVDARNFRESGNKSRSNTVRFSTKFSSTEEDSDYYPSLRPTTSMPNLQESIDTGYCTLPLDLQSGISNSFLSNSSPGSHVYERSKTRSSDGRRSILSKRKLSLGSVILSSEDHGDTTDALIEEAADFSRKLNKLSLSPQHDRVISTTTTPPPPSKRDQMRRRSSLGRLHYSSNLPQSSLRHSEKQSSLSSALRARSETDLRMVGTLANGRYGQPPYLPYSKDELALGQVVKVLVPGEGVAMAKVVYNPPSNLQSIRGQSLKNGDISVLLLSEPNNYCGSVVSLPLNKVLLAWPKA